MPATPRRNDPCPCGSGRKFKHCCEGATTWRDNSLLMGAAVVLLLVIGIVLASMAFSGGSDEGAGQCPPGQVWSPEHGHCH